LSESVEYLTTADLVDLATLLLGDPPLIRDLGLLGSAVARPQTNLFGDDAYPDIWTKAAALLHSLVKDNPLVDGNKRLAWLGTAVFLEINGVGVNGMANDDAYELVMEVAANPWEVEALADRLRGLSRT